MTITATQEALHFLEEREGAVLYWQAPPLGISWPNLVEQGVVLFDKESDCYVHPAAVKLENPHGSSWRMPVLQDYCVRAVNRMGSVAYVDVFGPNDGQHLVALRGDNGFGVHWETGRKAHDFEIPLIKRAAEEAMK